MNDEFYRRFEDEFRGSREEIKRRLEFYVQFVKPLGIRSGGGSAIDLGCGRGEWMEVLRDIGIAPLGIDSSNLMLAPAKEMGLNVVKADFLEYLTRVPSESQLIVSAFHLIEHIDFSKLLALIAESFRVLKPGGLLILETPNPENIKIAGCNFYLDPTHNKPIPPQLLEFISRQFQFERTRILRLNSSVSNCDKITIADVFSGSSQDYAVICQKSGSADLIEQINSIWDIRDDIGLLEMANLYEHNATKRTAEFQAKLEELDAQLKEVREFSMRTAELIRSGENGWIKRVLRRLKNIARRLYGHFF